MSNRKISELDDLSEVTSDDLAVVVDISTLTTRKASMANLRSYFQSELPRPKIQTITINNSHLTNKSLTLTNAPLLGYNVTILPRNGCPQFLNEDFVIDGLTVTWDGYGLDGLLEVGDVLQVSYFF
jgi:hypothetical protein